MSVTTVLVTFTVGVAALMLWLVGVFQPKVAHGVASALANRPLGSARVVEVVARTLPLEETAVGTVQPVHRIELASRLLARVTEVNVVAGQHVTRDEVLVRLEQVDLQARRAQAESAVDQAKAALDQARTEESRLRAGFERGGVAAIDMDRAVNTLKGAEATLARAQQSLTEAESVMEYATIKSPIDATVIDRRVNAGDTVSPGQVVVTLLDPKQMQMVASVRESLSRFLHVGGSVSVKIDALDHTCSGTVSEIVPEADSASRTFQVKVVGPCPEGVYTGMFGRLSIPVGVASVLLIPCDAIHTIGQLECVDVAVDSQRERRALRLGRTIEGQVEVLSGLVPGEKVVVDAPAAPGGK